MASSEPVALASGGYEAAEPPVVVASKVCRQLSGNKYVDNWGHHFIVEQDGCSVQFDYDGSVKTGTLNGSTLKVVGWKADGTVLDDGNVHFADGGTWTKAKKGSYGDLDIDNDDDDDDEGREAVTDPENLTRLIDHLWALEEANTGVVEALHCADYWQIEGLLAPLQHHSITLKLSGGDYLRLHLLRDGLAWKSYDMQLPGARYPQLPDNLAFRQLYEITTFMSVVALRKFCQQNNKWLWPELDSEQFAKGALNTLGVGPQQMSAADKVADLLANMGLTVSDACEEGRTPSHGSQEMTEEEMQAGAMKYAQEAYEIKMQEMDKDEQKLRAWLKENDFGTNVNQGRRKKVVKSFPLHVAAKHNEPEMVHLLLHFGAKKELTNSKFQTPLDVAKQCDKDGSHAQVISLLQGQVWEKCVVMFDFDQTTSIIHVFHFLCDPGNTKYQEQLRTRQSDPTSVDANFTSILEDLAEAGPAHTEKGQMWKLVQVMRKRGSTDVIDILFGGRQRVQELSDMCKRANDAGATFYILSRGYAGVARLMLHAIGLLECYKEVYAMTRSHYAKRGPQPLDKDAEQQSLGQDYDALLVDSNGEVASWPDWFDTNSKAEVCQKIARYHATGDRKLMDDATAKAVPVLLVDDDLKLEIEPAIKASSPKVYAIPVPKQAGIGESEMTLVSDFVSGNCFWLNNTRVDFSK